MEPIFRTEPRLLPILNALKEREPIFHTTAYGNSPGDRERVLDADYWEVGASGRRYSRDYVLGVLEKRDEILIDPSWQTRDFWCRELASDTYLLTYTLAQGDRITRRSTIWRQTTQGWKILYHQGTIVQDS